MVTRTEKKTSFFHCLFINVGMNSPWPCLSHMPSPGMLPAGWGYCYQLSQGPFDQRERGIISDRLRERQTPRGRGGFGRIQITDVHCRMQLSTLICDLFSFTPNY